MRDAALVNGTAAHALDYDDISWTLYGHPSVAILPALLAVAEAENSSSADLLDAYTVGVEVAAKLGHWANPALYLRGWHATAALGVLGAASGVARLLRLPAAGIVNALGIAASHAAGLRENFGTMVKPLHAGRAAEAGLLSAMLAKEGFTASEHALDGRFGFFSVLATETTPTLSEVAQVLGQPWEVNNPGIVLKRYPSCGATHCALDALLDMKGELNFSGEDVAEIRCGAEPLALKVLQYPRPVTGLQGKFSMEFCLAVAALEGQPRLGHFTDDWARRPEVIAMVPRIVVEDRPDLGKARNDAVPADVEIRLDDGRSARRIVSVPSGDPRRPMTAAERRDKFLDCAGEMPKGGADAWDSLQGLADSRPVAPILAGLREAPARSGGG